MMSMHEGKQRQAERRAEAHREKRRRQRWAYLSERERQAFLQKAPVQVQNGVQLAAMHGQTLWRRRPLWQAVRPFLGPHSQARVTLAKA
jgi:hypothetical protein